MNVITIKETLSKRVRFKMGGLLKHPMQASYGTVQNGNKINQRGSMDLLA
jgi:hypothetical protein